MCHVRGVVDTPADCSESFRIFGMPPLHVSIRSHAGRSVSSKLREEVGVQDILLQVGDVAQPDAATHHEADHLPAAAE